MASNKTKVNQIHDLLPKHLNSEQNVNWKALVEALGEADQGTADLVSEVRKQFFVKTASRPYIDRLAANNKIARPKLIGMEDPSFRKYIPVMSYQPKQVKLIIDQLLDVFFFKESTTAFVTTSAYGPYDLNNNWELDLFIDEHFKDRVIFSSDDFTNIHAATPNEIVAAINRQTKYCYATAYYDSTTQYTFIRIFTNTIGSKGSVRVLGGRANIALRLNGFISTAGNGSDTQWLVTKIGDKVTFQYNGGTSPVLSQVQIGNIVLIDLAGNSGSFEISDVNLLDNSITFTNLFGTTGTFTQTSTNQVKFIENNKYVAYLNPHRAMTWETTSGQITVELPASPPVMKRALKGSLHINGASSEMTNRDSNTSITVANAFNFPESGSFYLEPVQEIMSRILTISENTIVSNKMNSRLENGLQRYEYSSRVALNTMGDIIAGAAQITNLASTVNLSVGQQVSMNGVPKYARVTNIVGNTIDISSPATITSSGSVVKFLGNQLTGITPNLPEVASLNEFTISTLYRNSNVVTGITTAPHSFKVGENVIISNTSGGSGDWDGCYIITSINSTTFTYAQNGINDTAITLGEARVERIAMSNSGSKVILSHSISNSSTRITGPYIWDNTADFVLSSNIGETQDIIQAGKIIRLLDIGSNTLSKNGGYIVFNYGKNNQEGPIRYLYKPTDNIIALDPSYTFQNTHTVGSSVVAINNKGPHTMTGSASEYAPYITDPSEARIILEDLIRSVKSAGIFIDFLVRYPEQLYATLDVYGSGVDPG